METRSQRYAKKAFNVVHKYNVIEKDYYAFVKRFPTLIHTCGLAQAVSFANAKEHKGYIKDLETVMDQSLAESHSIEAMRYIRLSREAIVAASWLKRFAEAKKLEQGGTNAS